MTELVRSESDLVFQAVEALRQLKRNMLIDSFAFGRILHGLGIKRGSDGEKKAPYKLYASHIKNQGEFAKEIGMSLSSLHNIVGIYLAFGLFMEQKALDNGILEILPTRLVRLLPLQLNDDEKQEWLIKAAVYGADAFQNAINERQGRITTDECEHPECEAWSKCKTCGVMLKL